MFYLGGYDPVDADAQYRRFSRQLKIFTRTWNVAAELGAIKVSDATSCAQWRIASYTSDWRVDTVFDVMLWDDLVRKDLSQPFFTRILNGSLHYFDFIVSGALRRYFAANWRYGSYYLYPMLMSAVLACCAGLLAYKMAVWSDPTGFREVAVRLPLGILMFVGLLWLVGGRLRILSLLDLWSFTYDYIRGNRRDLEERLDQFAKLLIEQARDRTVDEIIIVGHSLGAMLAVDVAARALGLDPGFASVGTSVCVLTVGATIPKVVLHEKAGQRRDATAVVAAEASIAWWEIYSIEDFISFYKFHPVELKRIDRQWPREKPNIRKFPLRRMLRPATYNRYRFHFLRLHYQTVMANDAHSEYDFFLALCGPIEFVRWIKAPGGLLDFVAPDGTCRRRSLHGDPGAGGSGL
jgi:pimeloyl-ACP methyl ester carboxylesterase